MLYKNNSINSQHTRPIWPTHCSTVLDNFISLSLVFVVFPIRDRIANGNIQNMGINIVHVKHVASVHF